MKKQAILKTLASVLVIAAVSSTATMVGAIKGLSPGSASALGVCLAVGLYVSLRELWFRRWWQD